MPRRTRLRSRLIGMAILNALLLLGITLLLTWRARESHREVSALVSNDARVMSQLEELRRYQSSFTARWLELAAAPPEERVRLASRYNLVAMLSGSRFADPDVTPLRNETKEFAQLVRRIAATGVTDPATAARNDARVQRLSDTINADANQLVTQRKDKIEAKIPDLETSASNTMFVALGLAWIVAVTSFVAVRLALAKVVVPLEDLTNAASRVRSGDYDARVVIRGDHEVAELSERFNSMVDSLARMTEQLSKQASTDELTGLPNFRSFSSTIQAEIERASRYEESFGILVFDLDHFKSYNDTYGHAAGNEALRAVADVIRKALRAVDTPARYGGEEFAAIVPQIDIRSLGVIAERIRSGIEALPPIAGRRSITVSIGAAIFPRDGAAAKLLFEAADERLYAAKKKGRNCVVLPSEKRAKKNTAS